MLFQNGKKVIGDIRIKTTEDPKDNHVLLILETVPEDTGKYECVVLNSAGEARCEAELSVHGPKSPTSTRPTKPSTSGVEKAPAVLEPLKDQTIKEGAAVAFACKITGKPIPEVQWKKGDKVRIILKKKKFIYN